MALSNRDRIDRMFQIMAPVLDDYLAAVTGQGDKATGAAWTKLVQAKDAKGWWFPPNRGGFGYAASRTGAAVFS